MLYKNFMREHVVKRISELTNPHMSLLTDFEFPRNSLFHYLPNSTQLEMPDMKSSWFSNIDGPIFVNHVVDLYNPEGSFKIVDRSSTNDIRTFHSANKDTKRMADDTVTVAEQRLMVFNYGLLRKKYQYVKAASSAYLEWKNLFKTLVSNVTQQALVTTRNQFIVINVPEVTPTLQLLNTYSETLNSAGYKLFSTEARMEVLDIYRWLSKETHDRSILSMIHTQDLYKVNLVFVYRDRYSVLNLGYLNAINADFSDLNTDFAAGVGQLGFNSTTSLNSLQLRKCFIVYVNAAKAVINEDPDKLEEHTEADVDAEEDLEGIIDQVDSTIAVISLTNKDKEDILTLTEQEDVLDTTMFEEDLGFDNELLSDSELHAKLAALVERQIDVNNLSGREYKTLIGYVDKSLAIKNPYGSGKTILESIEVNDEELKITDEDISIPDQVTVLDKTMLKSTLLAYDKKYVKNTLPKHILATVASMQRAGILIEDYVIDKEVNAVGKYEEHNIRFRPIDGQPSTIRIRLPVVEEDGTFRTNNIRYRMKKQKTDLPIRKINEREVALSSYYGKIFVQRSEAKANDTGFWLKNVIMSRSIAPSPTEKAEFVVKSVNVFENKFRSPRVFSMLSMYFETIEHKDFVLQLNPKRRYSPEGTEYKNLTEYHQLETTHQGVFIGYTKTSLGKNDLPLIAKYDDKIYRVEADSSLTPMGYIFDLLGADRSKAPIEYSEIRLLGSKVPLIVVLGYYLGLTNVFKYYGVKPVVYPINKRIALAHDEYRVRFADISLVLKRGTKDSDILFAGLFKLEKYLRQYKYKMFETQAVYFNIMTDIGLTARYVSELKMLEDLFVDPMTELVLKKMNEPVEFKKLLIRANQLLATDYHLDSNDGAEMRIRGYERVAGAMYKTLAMSVRNYRNRRQGVRKQIEVKPFEVWQTVTQDPSVDLVKEINPFEYTKNVEAFTFGGEGGRSRDSMSKKTRAYSSSDQGVVSEATVDSGDVGINAYLSANPGLQDTLGMYSVIDQKDINMPAVLSTPTLSSAGSIHDD